MLDIGPAITYLITYKAIGAKMKSRELIKRLQADGWVEARQNGSHITFKKEGTSHLITVPHPKELKKGLVRQIEKDAGWG